MHMALFGKPAYDSELINMIRHLLKIKKRLDWSFIIHTIFFVTTTTTTTALIVFCY